MKFLKRQNLRGRQTLVGGCLDQGEADCQWARGAFWGLWSGCEAVQIDLNDAIYKNRKRLCCRVSSLRCEGLPSSFLVQSWPSLTAHQLPARVHHFLSSSWKAGVHLQFHVSTLLSPVSLNAMVGPGKAPLIGVEHSVQ
jgi:hypothetical protein